MFESFRDMFPCLVRDQASESKEKLRFAALGQALKHARVQRKLSQRAIAKATSMSLRQVALVEAGENVSLSYIYKIVKFLDVKELPLGVATVRVHAGDLKQLQGTFDRASQLAHEIASALAGVNFEEDSDGGDTRLSLVPPPAASPRQTLHRINPNIFEMEELPADFPFTIPAAVEILEEVEVVIDGYVAAGTGIDLVATGETVFLPKHVLPGEGEKVVIARGESMIDFEIKDRDIVIVQLRPNGLVAHNEIVIAWYDGGMVIKKWYAKKKRRMLISGNESHPPIEITEEDIQTGNFRVQAVVRRSFTRSFKVKYFDKISG